MVQEYDWRILSDFCKNHIQSSIANESIRTRLKKRMTQANEDNNTSVTNEINYNYSRANNKGIIILPESLRIDITPKIESLMIIFKNIDENGNKKIYFSRNRLPILRFAAEEKLAFTGARWISCTCSK